MNTIDEAIRILLAMQEGKEIQAMVKDTGWNKRDVSADVMPNFQYFTYRIKPEPLEFWVNVYPHGSACLHETEKLAIQHRSDGVSRTIKVIEVIE